tara:strand:- start:365 stop:631 length:267 start_codon:yes stop_codon:yes gene_type:complete
MTTAPTMNPVQKVAWFEHQVRQAEFGNITTIDCPWCGLSVSLGAESLCCDNAGEAVAAILHRMEVQDQLDQVARIAEGADRQRSALIH